MNGIFEDVRIVGLLSIINLQGAGHTGTICLAEEFNSSQSV